MNVIQLLLVIGINTQGMKFFSPLFLNSTNKGLTDYVWEDTHQKNVVLLTGQPFLANISYQEYF